jgi:hypothetical protein
MLPPVPPSLFPEYDTAKDQASDQDNYDDIEESSPELPRVPEVDKPKEQPSEDEAADDNG